MIINHEIIHNKYACGKTVARVLQSDFNIPLLSVEGRLFYFLETEELESALKQLPWWLKLINTIEK